MSMALITWCVLTHGSALLAQVPVNWQEIAGSTLNPLTATVQMAKDIFYIRTLYLTGYWKISH